MSELSFLLDLLLNEKLSKPVKEKITARVQEVEKLMTAQPIVARPPAQQITAALPPHIANQSPSTIAKFLQHEAEGLPPVTAIGEIVPGVVNDNVPAVIAATPQTQAALLKREQAIATALSGKPEAGRSSPRKF